MATATKAGIKVSTGSAQHTLVAGGGDRVVVDGWTDYLIDDLAGAQASAAGVAYVPVPGAAVVSPSAAGATGAVHSDGYDIRVESPAAGATAASGSPSIRVQTPAAVATAAATVPVMAPGAAIHAPGGAAAQGHVQNPDFVPQDMAISAPPATASGSVGGPVFVPGTAVHAPTAAGATAAIHVDGFDVRAEVAASGATAGSAVPLFLGGDVLLATSGALATAESPTPSVRASLADAGSAVAAATGTNARVSVPAAAATAGSDIPSIADRVAAAGADAEVAQLALRIGIPDAGGATAAVPAPTVNPGDRVFDSTAASATGAVYTDGFNVATEAPSAGGEAAVTPPSVLPGPLFTAPEAAVATAGAPDTLGVIVEAPATAATAAAPAMAILPGSLSFASEPAACSAEASGSHARVGQLPASASAAAAEPVYVPGAVSFVASLAAGANAGALSAGHAWQIEFPSAGASAGAAVPAVIPGVSHFTAPSADAGASVGRVSVAVDVPSAAASAEASVPAVAPGPVIFAVSTAAGANAGAVTPGHAWSIEYPAVGATAAAPNMGILTGASDLRPDAAGASAEVAELGLQAGWPAAGAAASVPETHVVGIRVSTAGESHALVSGAGDAVTARVPYPLFVAEPLSFHVSVAAGANAGAVSEGHHWVIEYPAVQAVAGSTDPVIRPGPLVFDTPVATAAAGATDAAIIPGVVFLVTEAAAAAAEASGAGASVSTAGAGATAAAPQSTFVPGLAVWEAGLAAGANAGALSAGHAWSVEYPAVGATAAAADVVVDVGPAPFVTDAAAAVASVPTLSLGAGALPAAASASVPASTVLPGALEFVVGLAASANAGAVSTGHEWSIEYPAVGATASGASPSFVPGPIAFHASASAPATAGASNVSAGVEALPAGATAAARTVDVVSGPVVFVADGAAEALAAAIESGHHWQIHHTAAGASAGASDVDLRVTLIAAAAAAGVAEDMLLPVPPFPPANFTALRPDPFTTVYLSWDSVAGATAYQILKNDGYRGVPDILDTTTNLSYNDGSLDPRATLSYSVRAINSVMGVTGLRSQPVYVHAKHEIPA